MKFLICIAFHYPNNHINYLHSVIDNIILTYTCYKRICVDTNSYEAKNLLEYKYKDYIGFELEIIVHDNLEHPFLLTSVHRDYIFKHINEYDLVMYSEDDILVTYNSILDFLDKLKDLWPKYIPCFKRCEYSKIKRQHAFLDVEGKQTIEYTDIIEINDKQYFTPTYPNFAYQGCWILPTKLLLESMDLNGFLNKTTYREHMASYTLGPPPYHTYDNTYLGSNFLNKIPLFELNNENQIHNNCLIFHLENCHVDIFYPTYCDWCLINDLIIMKK